MKGKIKHRLLAIALCIAMLVTSVNITNLFNNDINATTDVKVSVTNDPKLAAFLKICCK